MSSDAHQSVAQPQPDSVPIALEGLLERSPSAFPVVRLPILGTDAVVIGSRDRSVEVVTEDGFLRTVYVGDQAEPVTDPEREAALLRRALRSVHAQAQESREHLTRAEAEHADTLARIRAYAIGKHRSGDICRTGLDEFLAEFALGGVRPAGAGQLHDRRHVRGE